MSFLLWLFLTFRIVSVGDLDVEDDGRSSDVDIPPRINFQHFWRRTAANRHVVIGTAISVVGQTGWMWSILVLKYAHLVRRNQICNVLHRILTTCEKQRNTFFHDNVALRRTTSKKSNKQLYELETESVSNVLSVIFQSPNVQSVNIHLSNFPPPLTNNIANPIFNTDYPTDLLYSLQ